MASVIYFQNSLCVHAGLKSVHLKGQFSLCADEIQLQKKLLVIVQSVEMFRYPAGEHLQNSGNFCLFRQIQLPQLVVHIYNGLGFDE